MIRFAAATTFSVLVVSAAAQANPINYVEPPDLSAFIAAPTTLPTFDFGINTVSGHMDHNAGDNTDAFLISLPAGATLSSVTLTISNFTAQDANPNWGIFCAPGATASLSVGGNGLGNNTIPFSQTFPASLSYFMFGTTAGASDIAGNPFGAFSSYDYTWSFTVVPTPSAAGLLGLAGLAATRRRR